MTMSVALDKTNKLISIEHAERGLACDCFCFECGEPVLAKKGEKNEHHFAHIELSWFYWRQVYLSQAA